MTWTEPHDEDGQPQDLVERVHELRRALQEEGPAVAILHARKLDELLVLTTDLSALCEELSDHFLTVGALLTRPISDNARPRTAKQVRLYAMSLMKNEDSSPRFPVKSC